AAGDRRAAEKSAAVGDDRVDGVAAAVEENHDRLFGDDGGGSVFPRMAAEARRPHRLHSPLRPRPPRTWPAVSFDRRGDHLAHHRLHVLSDEETDSWRDS